MDTQKLHTIFKNKKDYIQNKFNLFIDYSVKINKINKKIANEWFFLNGIKNTYDLSKYHDAFITYLISLYTSDLNSAKLALYLVRKDKVKLDAIIENNSKTDYLFNEWLKSLNVVALNYTKDFRSDEERHSKIIMKEGNLLFSFAKKQKKDFIGKSPQGFKVYGVVDDCDLVHIVDNSKYDYETNKYGTTLTSIVDTDFKGNIEFNYLNSKNINFI